MEWISELMVEWYLGQDGTLNFEIIPELQINQISSLKILKNMHFPWSYVSPCCPCYHTPDWMKEQRTCCKLGLQLLISIKFPDSVEMQRQTIGRTKSNSG